MGFLQYILGLTVTLVVSKDGGAAMALLMQKSINKNISAVQQPSMIEEIFYKPTAYIFPRKLSSSLFSDKKKHFIAGNLLCGLSRLAVMCCT